MLTTSIELKCCPYTLQHRRVRRCTTVAVVVTSQSLLLGGMSEATSLQRVNNMDEDQRITGVFFHILLRIHYCKDLPSLDTPFLGFLYFRFRLLDQVRDSKLLKIQRGKVDINDEIHLELSFSLEEYSPSDIISALEDGKFRVEVIESHFRSTSSWQCEEIPLLAWEGKRCLPILMGERFDLRELIHTGAPFSRLNRHKIIQMVQPINSSVTENLHPCILYFTMSSICIPMESAQVLSSSNARSLFDIDDLEIKKDDRKNRKAHSSQHHKRSKMEDGGIDHVGDYDDLADADYIEQLNENKNYAERQREEERRRKREELKREERRLQQKIEIETKQREEERKREALKREEELVEEERRREEERLREMIEAVKSPIHFKKAKTPVRKEARVILQTPSTSDDDEIITADEDLTEYDHIRDVESSAEFRVSRERDVDRKFRKNSSKKGGPIYEPKTMIRDCSACQSDVTDKRQEREGKTKIDPTSSSTTRRERSNVDTNGRSKREAGDEDIRKTDNKNTYDRSRLHSHQETEERRTIREERSGRNLRENSGRDIFVPINEGLHSSHPHEGKIYLDKFDGMDVEGDATYREFVWREAISAEKACHDLEEIQRQIEEKRDHYRTVYDRMVAKEYKSPNHRVQFGRP
ncbi:hypothetical protein PROFUN_07116 [Planoprotostelium fungivorum]|uniref:Uncharacterized protein n=1 Tax=Planoprotostelium fungivorum TaxID=1890364 RepID=A0A2P6NMK8_9EUKA|nr:hypothetical protein PROFUN_07116 [Planoprotostelium fungivorum]